MEAAIFVCEGGIIVDDMESDSNLLSVPFSGDKAQKYLALTSGQSIPELDYTLSALREKGVDSVSYNEPVISSIVSRVIPRNRMAPRDQIAKFEQRKLEKMTDLGLVKNEEEALLVIREISLSTASAKLKEMVALPDLHIVQAIQALDELDKSVNILFARTREWYGLHFPELSRLVEDNEAFAKIVGAGKSRENLLEEDLADFSFSKARISAIMETRDRSKGSPLGEKEHHNLQRIAESSIGLQNDREKVQEYVDAAMRSLAPNLTSIAGSTIGARLISKAGGLEKLARMPAGKIQILGAEKALYRALRSGSRPPKHGILFQHQLVHSSPKWQRGKIARSLASKIAIAARIDAYRGTEEVGLEASLEKKISEIRAKYPEPKLPTRQERDEVAYVRRSKPKRNRKH